jgi:hypothetical protein
MPNNVLLVFESPLKSHTLTFEDDGKVAYAYLKHANTMISAVWLYNRVSAPTIDEWKNPANIPFTNCAGFVLDGARIHRSVSADDVRVTWKFENGMPVANIYVFGDLYGVLDTDSKVGYARFAMRDSPLARVMVVE